MRTRGNKPQLVRILKRSNTRDGYAKGGDVVRSMKQHFRFTRLKFRGLAGAAEEFLLVATIQNLRRLIRLRALGNPKCLVYRLPERKIITAR